MAIAAAIAATAFAPRAAAAVTDVQATATSDTATITWTTSTPSRGRVAYGVGAPVLYSVREPVSTTAHRIALDDLEPATTYIVDVAGVGRTLTTRALTGAPQFGVQGTHVTLDGSLFFPVMSYEQCAETIDRALALGINTFVQVPYTGCTHPAGVTPPYVLSDDYGGAQGIGWYLPDEPDGWGIPPDKLPKLPSAQEDGRLRVLNVSQHFFSGQAPINATFDRNDYTRFAAAADVVGFDMYPIVKFCGRVSLLQMFQAQRELMTIYAPGKPTFQWIETSKMTGECPTIPITPAIVNAESWLAVAGGACGLGYFTNSWTGDLWNRWDFDPGVELQIAQTVARVERLAPALCTDVESVVVPWNGTVAASARAVNGATYVVAVNASPTPTTIPFRVDGLSNRPLTVLDENRTLKPTKKIYFRDRFDGYAVHVYVAPPA